MPDISSTLGDPREHAETLQGNHTEICRVSGTEDQNYRKVTGELRGFYRSIVKLSKPAEPASGVPSQAAELSNVEKGVQSPEPL